jgi:hypothetical protein
MRNSSVEMLERHPGSAAEVGILILRNAADYLYAMQENGNPDIYRAVDLLDGIRERQESAHNPHHVAPAA